MNELKGGDIMTARTTIANYESKVREYTNFAIRGIKKVCKECGPRECGKEAERKAQQMMAKDLEDCCERVEIEDFKVAPRAFMGWVRLSLGLALASVLVYNMGQAWLSVILLAACLFFMVTEFLLYKQTLDPFFRKRISCNVVGVRAPKGEVKRRIILCGHADSAPEWRFTYYGHKLFGTTKLLHIMVALSVVSILFLLGSAVAAIAAGHAAAGIGSLAARGVFNTLGYVQIGFCAPLLVTMLFHNNNRFVEGANDNLTGCYTGMAVAKLLGATNTRLEHTELVVLNSGGEEAGLRGAKAFCKAHAEEFKDAETVFIALDTMTEFDHAAIYYTDLTSTIKHDPAVCAMMKQGAKNAGYDIPYALLPFGASDAAAAKQAGIRSAAFAAMDQAPPPYYHTRLDTVDLLDQKAMEACLNIVMEIAWQFDQTGLAPFEGSKIK